MKITFYTKAGVPLNFFPAGLGRILHFTGSCVKGHFHNLCEELIALHFQPLAMEVE
jgi:hypothetical protein